MTNTPARKPASKKTSREDILLVSMPLFAKAGFDGISMRDIASAAGVTPAALYHHFADKDSLYLALIDLAFNEKAGDLKAILQRQTPARQRLEQFVAAFTQVLSANPDFQRLLHWTLLESTDARMQALADDVFLDLVCCVKQLVEELKADFDPLLLTVSIMGLILFPFEAAKASRHIPGYRAAHRQPDVLARHIIDLLTTGLGEHAAGSNRHATSHSTR